MKKLRLPCLMLLFGLLASVPACGGCGARRNEGVYGKYTLYATKYDETDLAKAENNAADVLTKLANDKDVCLVGLWAYNPPAMLTATKKVKKEGKVKIVGFDEDENTLKGIKDGHIYGTVVQQPFEFGYQSVSVMAYLAKNPEKDLPEEIVVGEDKVKLKDGAYYVPHKVITKDNVEDFHQKLKDQIAAGKAEAPKTSGKLKVAFVTNNPHEFWTIAEAGTRKAAVDFDVEVVFRRPQKGTAAEQKTIIEDLLNNNVKAIAISVNDPENQKDFLNEVASKVPLITQDNDAPATKRKCYIGTDNVVAGQAVGKLVKKAMPDGGTIAIFVGQPDPLNAKQRKQGVLDELKND